MVIGITNAVKPLTVQLGEDAVSYKRHIKVLQVEFKKGHHNGAVVENLMKRSFAGRRAEIEKEYDLQALFCSFPFLQDVDQVGFLFYDFFSSP